MRQLIKKLLAFLTKWAIKKHDIEIIAILGEKHSRLTSYILWEALRDDYFTRCQWDKSFWDLSIPLTILGYPAKQKSIFEWIFTILRAFFVLLTSKSVSQTIILHIPYSLPEILEYWFEIIGPDVLVYFAGDIKEERMEIIKKNISKETEIVEIGSKIDRNWLKDKNINYSLPGVFWENPILAASYVAHVIYDIPISTINQSLKEVEPLEFLNVKENIEG